MSTTHPAKRKRVAGAESGAVEACATSAAVGEAGERSVDGENVSAKAPSAPAVPDEPEVSVVGGLRRVAPYPLRYASRARPRWVGQQLLDFYASEFGAYPRDYFARAIAAGTITVNGARASPDVVIREGDVLEHVLHFHEPPVALGPTGRIEVVAETDGLVAVNKPATVPVHPGGVYRHNSVIKLLQRQRGDPTPLLTVHRLDRLTSGLLVLAKTRAAAHQLSKNMQGGRLSKRYLARVRGRFPQHDDVGAADAVAGVPTVAGFAEAAWQEDGTLLFSCPVKRTSSKDNLMACAADGKEARTLIRVLARGDDDSIVECEPLTGRTHQIRLHLQALGHPIVDCPVYGGTMAVHAGATYLGGSGAGVAGADAGSGGAAAGAGGAVETTGAADDVEAVLPRLCVCCRDGEAAAFSEEQLRCSGLSLHAVAYTGPEWSFQAPLPQWAEGRVRMSQIRR